MGLLMITKCVRSDNNKNPIHDGGGGSQNLQDICTIQVKLKKPSVRNKNTYTISLHQKRPTL